MTFKLIQPNQSYQQSYRNYIIELGEEERYPFPLDFEYNDFSSLLNRLDDLNKGVNIPTGYVPSSTFWMVQGGKLIGVSNLRHYLNDQIKIKKISQIK